MATKIQLRRDTAANWTTANPTLFSGEVGFETNTGKFKIGNGSTVWSSLDYFLDSSDLSGYLTAASASTTYLTQASASTTYLTQASASTSYLTQASASTTYLTQESASTTYLTATSPQVVLSAVTSNYTLALTDSNDFIPLTSSAAFTITVPADNTVNFPVGTRIDMVQLGTGQVTVAGQTNGAQTSLVRSTPGAKFRAQYSGATLVKISTNLWSLVGDLAA
jgi:hypothetical protein